MQQGERLAHHVSQLVFIAGIHDCNALSIASGRDLPMMINPADYNYIAADA